MKPFLHHRRCLLLVLILLSGSALTGARFLRVGPAKPEVETFNTMINSGSYSPHRPLAENDEYQAEIKTLFRQAHAAQQTSELISLVDFASKMENGPELEKLVAAMPSSQCLRLYKRILLYKSDSEGRATALDEVVQSLVGRNHGEQAEAITRWLLDRANNFPRPDEARGCAVTALIAWSGKDRLAAANFAASPVYESGNLPTLSWALLEICKYWGMTNANDAWTWVKKLPDTDPRKVYAVEGLCSDFVEFHPDEAKISIERMVGLDEHASVVAVVVAGRLAEWHQDEQETPQASMQWVLSLSDEPWQRDALQKVIDAWVVDPKKWSKVTQWATLLPPGRGRGTIWGAMAVSWMTNPNGNTGVELGGAKYYEIIQINRDAVNNWLLNLPAGTDRDEAISMQSKWEESFRKIHVWR